MHKLQAIAQSWHKRYTSQPKIKQNLKATFVKLNPRKKSKNFIRRPKQQSHQQYYHEKQSSQSKRITKKLASFIHKIQDTLKKILFQKDIKWYIAYAHTSETQIMDNVNNSLNKFKTLLYQLKQKAATQTMIPIDKQLCHTASQNLISSPYEDIQSMNKKSKHVNYDVLEFVLQYFEQHMIAQTHWSRQYKQQVQKSQKVDFLQKIFDIFHLDVCSNQTSHIEQIPQTHLRKTMTDIIQQIDRQQKQSLILPNNDLLISSPQLQIALKPIQQTLNAILKIENLKPIEQMISTQKIAYLLDLESKIFVSAEFIQSAAFFQDDITTLPKINFQNVWAFINENQLGDQKVLKEQYKMMKMLMIITNASVIKQLETDSRQNSWFRKIVFGLSFPKYFLDFNRAKLQNHKFLRKPSINTVKSIWNLPQNGFIRQIKKPFIFDYIKSNIQFYIPRTRSRNLKNFKGRLYDPSLDIFKPNQNSFKVRLLNHKELDIGNKKPGTVFYETIIIHYHGGGFIALSSCTSQTYTRKWANSLKVPVFSVDYGKPPEFRFPTPVLDCLDAYNFITCQIQKYFNIRPKRVFLTGDSAGGNLACSLTALTLKLEMKVPDGILLAYPAVDTRTKFTPSRINSFNDIILYPTLLLLCMKQYLGENEENQFNVLASPILLTEQFVSDTQNDQRWPLKWPKTIVMVGKKDPLYDDSLRLCQRFASSNIQFHCQVYKNLSHAFLSIDKMLPACAETISDSIKFFEKLMSGQPINRKKLL